MNKEIKIYVGIDFSKEKFNACLLTPAGVMGANEFPNTKSGYRDLLKWTRRHSELGRDFDCSAVLFCGEHTGMCSLGLAECLYKNGLKIWLESALKIKYGSGLNRAKDDKADAEMIAYYASRFYEPEKTVLFEPESHDIKELRSLYQFRNRIVKDRVALSNQIASNSFEYSSYVKAEMKKKKDEAIREEKEIEQEMIKLMRSSAELSENYKILTSFKGVGPITAAVLIIYTSNFKKFDDPRKFACFCGIAPFGRQSGTSINTKPHVSRFAHINVKAAIVQACQSAIISNPVIREYALRLKKKGKHEGVIMNNVKNKIIHILFKMVKTKTLWNPEYQQAHEEKSEITSEYKHEKEEVVKFTPSVSVINCLRHSEVYSGDTPINIHEFKDVQLK